MIKLGILSDFTDTERAKLQEACDWVNRALKDQRFLDMLEAATYDSTDLTGTEVVALVQHDVTITRLYCEYLGWWATHVYKTVAQEEEDGTVTFNRPKFDGETIPALANTLFHETLHVLGQHHASARDYLSVPYQGGNLMEEFLDWFMNQPLEPTCTPAPLSTALAHATAAEETK